MVEVKFHCAMPIFVARQWIRHRTANVNERSGRYSLLRPVFYKPEVFRSQATANKQGSKGPVDDPWIDEEAQRRLGECRETAINAYEWMTKHDIARELARIDLPLSTYTQWYWKIDLHNLMHFLKLRVDPHAQWEIQEYGRVMAGMFKRLAPLSYKAWIDYDVCGVRFSREERLALQKLLTHREREIEGGARDECDLALEGLTARERAEFFEKLKAPKSPCFELDLAQAREPSTFQLLKREGA
jgi:thymidylate synthase (FAD)